MNYHFISFIIILLVCFSCNKNSKNENTNSDVKIIHTENNTKIYTFWKDGFQLLNVYEIDENGKYLEDTTTISYKITPEIPRPDDNIEFELKINNPNLKIIKSFIGTRFNEVIDTINKPTKDNFFFNNEFKTKKKGSIGDNVFLINILADYKGVIKYYKVKVRYYVLPENEIEKYYNKELSEYYYPLNYMKLHKNDPFLFP